MSASSEAGHDHGAVREPSIALAGYVTRLVGYDLRGRPGIHLGMPSRSLTLILPLELPTVVSGPVRSGSDSEYSTPTALHGLLGGLHARAVRIHHDGRQRGIQLEVTPAGARALFGCPAAELADRVITLAEALGPAATDLADRLAELPTWDERLRAVDDALAARQNGDAVAARDRTPETWEAWRLLSRTDGRAPVEAVAARIGWSRRHLSGRFRTEFGHPPKVVARLMRFEHSRALLALPNARAADVAAACGFADQAHLTRQWRAIAGCTPTAWRAAEVFPNVQDIASDDEPR